MLVWVSATAATEDEAWRAAMVQLLSPFRYQRWHDSTETVLQLLVALRQECPQYGLPIAAAGADALPQRQQADSSARWFTPVEPAESGQAELGAFPA